MQDKSSHISYRRDIDGLRAIAVLAVIIFHLGYMPNGFLGVDVFFVISGFLITKIIYKEAAEQQFSIATFYLRRTRRIIPLLLFVDVAVLLLGCFFMLPDDLENLSQSVVATNLFGNNILQYITTGNYWDVVNEYKPMMHTWSLGIEEQFYLIYPLIFITFVRKRSNWIMPALVLLSLISLGLYLAPGADAAKFYLLPYRFFELSVGGIAAVHMKDRLIRHPLTIIFVPVLLVLLCVPTGIPAPLALCLSVAAALGILLSDNQNTVSAYILENRLMVWLGKISFSLYMWHQLVFAFARYAFLQHFTLWNSLLLLLIVLLLSALSFTWIERPFRNKATISNRKLLWCVSVLFVLTTGAALYLYARVGVIRNVPELDIDKAHVQRHMHSAYNDRVYNMDHDFSAKNTIKVLVIGNSFARDWANILLESAYGPQIEVSYIYDIHKSVTLRKRLDQASYIFMSDMPNAAFEKLVAQYRIDKAKTWIIGIKRFGENNGIFYNRRWQSGYCAQRVKIPADFLADNDLLKKSYSTRYIDLIGLIIDKNNTVPVFTPDCKYISQDCRHLTRSGAIYFAGLLNHSTIFPLNNHQLK